MKKSSCIMKTNLITLSYGNDKDKQLYRIIKPRGWATVPLFVLVTMLVTKECHCGVPFCDSRENQLRYIWCMESNCDHAVLGDRETHSELGVHVNQHLDKVSNEAEPHYVANRLAKATHLGDMAGKGVPLSLVAVNPRSSDGDIRMGRRPLKHGVALSSGLTVWAGH